MLRTIFRTWLAIPSNRALLIIVSLACIAHLGVRMYTIADRGFDFDEAATWSLTRSLKDVVPLAVTDCHPPLYWILQTLWTGLFGTSEAAFRSLSTAFSLLLLLLLAMCIRDAQASNNSWAILASACVFSLLPYDIYFSRDARNYTMLVFLCSLFSYLFFRVVVSGEQRWFPYAALVGISAIYTHNLALMSIAAAAVAGVLSSPTRANLYVVAKLGLILAVGWIPWAVVMPIQMIHSMAAVRIFKQYSIWSLTEVPAGKLLALLNPHPSSLDSPDYGLLYDGIIAMPDDWLGWLGLSLAVLAVCIILINLGNIVRNVSIRPFFFQVVILSFFMALSPVAVFSQKAPYLFVFPAVLLLGYSFSELMRTKAKLLSIAFLVSFVAVSLGGFPYSNRGTDWKSLCGAVSQAWEKAQTPALLISPANEVLTLQYYISRGYCKCFNPVWMSLNLVVTVIPPFDKELKLNMLTEGNRLEWSLDETALASIMETVQRTEPATTDIFYIREGSGNLNLEWLNKEIGAWTTSRSRFGLMALYHLERKKSQASASK
ncbi:MAG TPA: glycosyltransferase family 39 protein [Desulfomonilaceae bacterium]|nr:glycosyltransferase family 39 protein [Desulfomonilaceae bacterium]